MIRAGENWKRFVPVCLAVLLVVSARPVEAGVKKIWAGDFSITTEGSQCVAEFSLYVKPGGGPCWFFKLVTLPPRSKVTKIQYMYTSTAAVHTGIGLETGFFPGNGPVLGQVEWIHAMDNFNTQGQLKTVESSFFEFGNRRLRRGEKIYLYANIADPGAGIRGVKIFYRR